MKFTFNPSPNLRQKQSTGRIMAEVTIALLVVFAFTLLYYQSEYDSAYMMQAVLLMFTSVATALLSETLWALFTKQNILKFLKTSFGWITAIILTLMCPISIPPYALAVSTFLAIFVGKLLFGGFGQNIFNPAALGRAIVFASFAGVTTDIVTGATPTTIMATEFNWLTLDSTMISSLFNKVDLMTLFTGWYDGGMGETSTLLIVIIGVILAIRKVIDWKTPVIYMGSIFLCASFIAIFSGMSDWLWYPIFHVCVGGAAFGAVFMLTDPVTSPTSSQGRVIFALGAGILTVLMRVLANLPEGCLYAILLMNMLTPAIEKVLTGKQIALQKKAWIMFGVISAIGIGSMYLATLSIEPATPKKVEVKPTVMIPMDDEYTNSLNASISSTTLNPDGTTTYVVSAEGFAVKEGPNIPNYGHPADPNIFDIIIEADGKTIKSVIASTVADSEYIGDKVNLEKYKSQFVGKDISTLTEVAKGDVVSGATYSVKSNMRAILEVKKALGY